MDWTLVLVCSMFTVTHLIVFRHYSWSNKHTLEQLAQVQQTLISWGWRAPATSNAVPLQPTRLAQETAVGVTDDGRLVRVPLAGDAPMGYGPPDSTMYDDQGALQG